MGMNMRHSKLSDTLKNRNVESNRWRSRRRSRKRKKRKEKENKKLRNQLDSLNIHSQPLTTIKELTNRVLTAHNNRLLFFSRLIQFLMNQPSYRFSCCISTTTYTPFVVFCRVYRFHRMLRNWNSIFGRFHSSSWQS